MHTTAEAAAGVGEGGPSTGNDGTTRQDSPQHSQDSTSATAGDTVDQLSITPGGRIGRLGGGHIRR